MKKILTVSMFFAISLILYTYFFITKNPMTSFGKDTVKQFVYFRHLIAEEYGGFNLFWSWSYGLGGDILGQFSYYYSTSIFFLFSLFFDNVSLEGLIEANIPIGIFKTFCGMVCMYALLSYETKSWMAKVVPSIAYGASLTFIKYNVHFDYMVDAFIWLPLLILSFIHYNKTGKGTWFTLAVALVCITNFYFAFIITLYLMIFVLLTYIQHENKSIKGFIIYVMKVAQYYVIGILMAAVTFLPATYQFLSTDRLNKSYDVPLFFDSSFYQSLFEMFFLTYRTTGSMGIMIFLIPIIITGLVIKKKTLNFSKYLLIVMLVIVCIPFFYSLFNGLSAMQNRFYFLVVFSICYVAGIMYDEALLNKKVLISSMGAVILYSFYKLFEENSAGTIFIIDKILYLLGILGIVALIITLYFKKLKVIGIIIIIFTVVLTGTINNYSFMKKNYGTINASQGVEILKNDINYGSPEGNEISTIIKNNEKEFGRTIWEDHSIEENISMMYGLKNSSTYQSLIPKNLHQLFKEKYNINHKLTMSIYDDYDQRIYLETAFANQFYVVKKERTFVPYGYKEIAQTKNWIIYENEYALPLGYSFSKSSWLTTETFENLSYAQKDQTAMAALVVNKDDQALQTVKSNFNKEQLAVEKLNVNLDEAKLLNIVKREDGSYLVGKSGGHIKFPIKQITSPTEILLNINIINTGGQTFDIKAGNKSIKQYANLSLWSYEKEHYVLNLGSSYTESEVSIELTGGVYNINEIFVEYNDLKNYQSEVENLQKHSLQNIRYEKNKVFGEATLEEDRLFFMSIPYSKGWTLKVDGEERDIYEVNNAFIGFPLEKGKHNIELIYVTPFFKIGALISLMAIGVLILINIMQRKRKK